MEFIFKESLKSPYTVVESLREVPEGEPLLVYSYVRPERSALWIFPHDLPLEFSISPQKVDVFQYNGHSVFFGTGQDEEEKPDLPYDIIALTFYMLSRYEEYVIRDRDEHGRFPASSSAAFQNGFLEHPVVDYGIEDLREALLKKWPSMPLKTPEFHVELSYDIDAPFAFHGKGRLKNLAAGILDILRMKNTGRLAYGLGKGEDPFDIFDTLLDQLDELGLKAVFFLLLEHRGGQDPSIDYRDPRFRAIVNRLAEKHQLGIHPSYNCDDKKVLHTEMARYKEVTGQSPEQSRFHYIRMDLPVSYHMIYYSGIFNDHSMGFPDHFGFRAGTSRNFRYYDLSSEVMTDLVVHPFCLMDATFEYYFKGLSEEQVLDKITEITGRIRDTGGKLSWVFHNDLISTYPSRYNWQALHKKVLQMMI